MTRVSRIAAAAALGVALTGGSAYAADNRPHPAPTVAPAAVTTAPSAADSLARAQVTPQDVVMAAGVTVRPYTRFQDRSFGFVFSGLLPTDTVTVTWRKVIDNGAVSTNVRRGTGAQEGMAFWYSGRQPGWLRAGATVTRAGAVILRQQMTNERAVKITSRRTGAGFSFFVEDAHPGDRMLIQWRDRGGALRSYEGPAEDYTVRRLPRWTTATIRVYAGMNRAYLVARPVTISSPSA